VATSASRRMLAGAFAVAWASAIVRLFGFAKQLVVAPAFGTGPEMDAFNGAAALPSLLTGILGAAVETTFVPIYIRARRSGDAAAADRAFSTLVNVSVVVFGLITAVSMAEAPALVRLTAPGFEPARFDLAVSLTPLLYPLLLVNVVVSLITSALNAKGAFARPMLAQGAVPLTVAVVVLVLGAQLGIVAMAVGELVGLLLGLALLMMSARAAGLRYSLALDWRSHELRVAAQQSLPVLVGSGLIHSNQFVDQLVASALPAGELSALNYALKLISLPVSVVFLAFSRATLPHFSEQVIREDWIGLRDAIRVNSWLMVGLTAAMTIGAGFLAQPVIGLLFERGKFDHESTVAVSATFVAAALGLVPMGLGFVIPRVFNALQRNDILTWITLFSVSANVVLDLLLAPHMGAVGIALATSLVYWAALMIQLVVLSRSLGGFNPLGAPAQLQTRWQHFARARGLQ